MATAYRQQRLYLETPLRDNRQKESTFWHAAVINDRLESCGSDLAPTIANAHSSDYVLGRNF